VSEEELRHAYQTHDIYVSPNHLQSWGLAVFEAMASGAPVIVSKTAGASEILTDGANALLVDGKAPEQIAQAIERLAGDPKLHAMLSMAGRKFVEENVTWKYSAKNAIKIFEDCLRGK
jgi:glycosyltransferase involved in cell wall biosynthesis